MLKAWQAAFSLIEPEGFLNLNLNKAACSRRQKAQYRAER
jgi:hypothetical protein